MLAQDIRIIVRGGIVELTISLISGTFITAVFISDDDDSVTILSQYRLAKEFGITLG